MSRYLPLWSSRPPNQEPHTSTGMSNTMSAKQQERQGHRQKRTGRYAEFPRSENDIELADDADVMVFVIAPNQVDRSAEMRLTKRLIRDHGEEKVVASSGGVYQGNELVATNVVLTPWATEQIRQAAKAEAGGRDV